LIISGGLIAASGILGVFYYTTQSNEQQILRSYQEKEYISKRKQECLEIYKIESEKWNNVTGWHYRLPSDNIFDTDYADKCVVEYKNTKTGDNFEKDF